MTEIFLCKISLKFKDCFFFSKHTCTYKKSISKNIFKNLNIFSILFFQIYVPPCKKSTIIFKILFINLNDTSL